MRNSLQNLYENMLVTEVMGAVNYWLSPAGELIHVPYSTTHMSYAQKHFDDVDWIQLHKDIQLGKVGWKDTYHAVYKAGYVRVVEYEFTIHISYDRARTPNSNQIHTLKELCEKKEKNLYDDETNKILIKQNEMDPTTFSRVSMADKLSKELKQPEFYKNKPFGDSFSAYTLNDYTKLIYEYNIPEEVPQSTPNNYRKDVPDPKPLPKNKEDEYRHAIIGDAIDGIKKAHEGNGVFSLKDTVQYWKDHLHIKGFTNEEIRQVIEMGLGYFDKVRKKPPFSENFSKYGLNDYTKLIYEYNMNEREFYDDNSDFGSYRKDIVIPKEEPHKIDYRQNLIDDAIEDIANAKKHDLGSKSKYGENPTIYDVYSLNSKIDYWEMVMREKNFTEDEIRRVIEMGLGDWDFRK